MTEEERYEQCRVCGNDFNWKDMGKHYVDEHKDITHQLIEIITEEIIAFLDRLWPSVAKKPENNIGDGGII